MKRAFLLCLLSGLALAGGSFAYKNSRTVQYQLDAVNSAPSSPTDGLVVVDPTTLAPMAALNVTIADFNDGGADQDYIKTAQARAWVYTPNVRQPDGGAGWQRMPQLDFDVDAGAVFTQGVTTRLDIKTVPMGGGSRLYFSTVGATGQDAGTPRHSVLIEARY